MSCGDPGVPDNAQRTGDAFLYQDTVVFTCDHGYYQSSGAEGGVRACLDTGLWSGTPPTCSCMYVCMCGGERGGGTKGGRREGRGRFIFMRTIIVL